VSSTLQRPVGFVIGRTTDYPRHASVVLRRVGDGLCPDEWRAFEVAVAQ
jgi:hypothetical protein